MEVLKTYLKLLPNDDAREAFATACGTTLGHMRNCLYSPVKRLAPAQCVLVEHHSARVVRRWDCRPGDWHEIWPELIGAEGAPDVPAPAANDASMNPAPEAA